MPLVAVVGKFANASIIFDVIKDNPGISCPEIQKITGWQKNHVGKKLRLMRKDNAIKARRQIKNSRWVNTFIVCVEQYTEQQPEKRAYKTNKQPLLYEEMAQAKNNKKLIDQYWITA